MPEKAPPTNSIGKALDILESLAEYGPSALADLNARLGLDKGTIHRILKLLKERGFVAQIKSSRRYVNTTRMFQLGSREIERGSFRTLARPHLEKLAETFREVVHVSVLADQRRAICVDKIEAASGSLMSLNLTLGSEVSLHASSMGKCLLAFADAGVQEAVLAELKYERFSPSTITNRTDLKKELARVRREGYAQDDGETLESLFCLGVPIFNHLSQAMAAISVSGPRGRILAKREAILAQLKAISQELSYFEG